MLGPLEMFLILVVWAVPIALLIWFVLAVRDIRDSLRRIERSLERSEPGS